MIELTTWLLGLIVGVVPVTLELAGEVAAVEIHLNGEQVANVSATGSPSLVIPIDFGPRLRPQLLEAMARDTKGRELDRVRRWINLEPQQVVEVSMALSGEPGRPPRAIHLAWESLGAVRPEAIEVTFDSQPLHVDDTTRIRLPDYDPGALHFVRATLRFPGDRVAGAELAFGGGSGSEIATELTAVAVTVDKGVRLPAAREMDAWFVRDGQPLTVHGVEEGSPEIVVVREPAARRKLRQVTELVTSRERTRTTRFNVPGFALPDHVAWQARVRFVASQAVPLGPTAVAASSFLHSPSHDAANTSLLSLVREVPPQRFRVQLERAVALAGMYAHASKRPRAVVLLLGDGAASDEPTVDDELSIPAVQGYLAQLQVPLIVLSTAEIEHHPEWGPVESISPDVKGALKRLQKSFQPLRDSLNAQRIVWLEGRHLPQSIEIAPSVEGIRLAGTDCTGASCAR